MTWPVLSKFARGRFKHHGHSAPSGFSKAKARLDKGMAAILGTTFQPWRTHDLRRTAASGMAAHGFLPHVIERVLNHVSGANPGRSSTPETLAAHRATALAYREAHRRELTKGLRANPCVAWQQCSPHARGTLCDQAWRGAYRRFIPAPAGEPCEWSFRAVLQRVYPRACGGTPRLPERSLRRRGLSPRLRGNLSSFGLRGWEPGSIPAPAGEPVQKQKAIF